MWPYHDILHRCFFLPVSIADKRQNELSSSATVWLGCKCVILMVFVIHLPSCVWYLMACTGFHYNVVCQCSNYTWAQKTGIEFGRLSFDFLFFVTT